MHLLSLAALLACDPGKPDSPADTDADADADTDADADADTDPVTDPEIDCTEAGQLTADALTDWPHAARTLSGAVTWTLTFDDDAKAAGFHDCQYTRTYADMVEVSDQGYLCPECTLLATGTAEMTSGYDDCFLQIDDADPERTEHVGLGTVDGALHFFRTGAENTHLADQGAVDVCKIAWSDDADLDAGGTMHLSAVGGFAAGEDTSVTLEDPDAVRTEPYACGWPLNNPGGPNSAWTLATGEVFPSVSLEDQCGEGVDLWDFWGEWLVIDASSVNCGPCQSMAGDAEAFKEEMAGEGIDVELITLLNESLSSINHPADLATRQDWVDTFGLSSPVLGDRGFGYALFPDYLQDDSGMSFPTILLINPEMQLVYGTSGYSSDSTFVELADLIRTNGG
jgi:hypothetical protein